jgi:hypothetical protein
MMAMYSSLKTPGFIWRPFHYSNPRRILYLLTKSEHEPPEQYLKDYQHSFNIQLMKPHSITIQRLDPFKKDPWYLNSNIFVSPPRANRPKALNENALCDVRRVQLGQDLYLLLYILNLIFRALKIDDLYGYCLLRSLVVTVECSTGGC